MAGFNAYNIEVPGTPEYVVARAGLLRLDAEGGHASDKLTWLFGRTPMPPLEVVGPALNAVAYFCNAELGGAIDMDRERMLALEGLKAIGLTDTSGARGEVLKAIREVIAEVAEECRRRPSFKINCGTSLMNNLPGEDAA